MSETSTDYSRLRRRETTSPRSIPAITTAIIILLICAYLATEIILRMLSQPPLLVQPSALIAGALTAPETVAAVVLTTGIAAALLGLVLIIAAVSPGRRSRHIVDTERTLTIVDDEVIASALSRRAAVDANVDPDAARVTVSARRAVVTLTAASGTPISIAPVADTVQKQLEGYRLSPPLTGSVRIDQRRKVGA